MTKEEFRSLLRERVLILDGATGTELQKRCMPSGVCPEKWVTENPDSIIEIQKAYIDAGSDIVFSCTFGANSLKLEQYGLQAEVYNLNKKLAGLSKNAAGDRALVAGEIGPTGQFIKPAGTLEFEKAVDVYKEQAEGLLAGGVDLFVIETMMDIQEARAALIAVLETTILPVMASMTINEDGRTLGGTDPATAAVILESLGADAVGCNCSTGPENLAEFINEMSGVCNIPLIAKPNAGLPKLIDGKTVFSMNSKEFGGHVETLVKAGANLIGGCCGTNPEYIELVAEKAGKPAINTKPIKFTTFTSGRKTLFLGYDDSAFIVGEKINASENEKLKNDVISGDFYAVADLADEQIEEGAQILKINLEIPETDEAKILTEAIGALSVSTSAPLLIDASNKEAFSEALRIYPGKALIDSASIPKTYMNDYICLIMKYGAVIIFNTDEEEADEDVEALNKEILIAAKAAGIKSNNLISVKRREKGPGYIKIYRV